MEVNNFKCQFGVLFLGSYTAAAGIAEIVHRVSEFIMQRDGGIPSDPGNIYISPGSQWALQVSPPNRLFLATSSLTQHLAFLLEHTEDPGHGRGSAQNGCPHPRPMLPVNHIVHNRGGSSPCSLLSQ